LTAAASGQNPKPALGQIVRALLASIDGIPVPSGGTVVAGDTLATAKAGGALVKFSSASQLEVAEDTSVTLNGTPSHVETKLSQGSVTASVQGTSYLAVETSQCRVEPAEATGAVYSVTLLPGVSASVTATHGRLTLVEAASGIHRALAEGQPGSCPSAASAARQEEGAPSPSQASGQAAPPTPAAHGSNTTLLLLLVGGGAAAGIAAAAAGGHGGGGGGPASPSAP